MKAHPCKQQLKLEPSNATLFSITHKVWQKLLVESHMFWIAKAFFFNLPFQEHRSRYNCGNSKATKWTLLFPCNISHSLCYCTTVSVTLSMLVACWHTKKGFPLTKNRGCGQFGFSSLGFQSWPTFTVEKQKCNQLLSPSARSLCSSHSFAKT